MLPGFFLYFSICHVVSSIIPSLYCDLICSGYHFTIASLLHTLLWPLVFTWLPVDLYCRVQLYNLNSSCSFVWVVRFSLHPDLNSKVQHAPPTIYSKYCVIFATLRHSPDGLNCPLLCCMMYVLIQYANSEKETNSVVEKRISEIVPAMCSSGPL